MIDDKVVNLARTFREACLQATTGLPLFELDMSWPSIGALDFLLFPLRFKASYERSELNSIHGAAAYIGGLVYDCWSRFEGVAPELKINPASELDVVLAAQGGAALEPGERFTINVSQTLLAVLNRPARPFPFFERTARYLHPNHNFLSLYGIGLFSGLTPYGAGPWKAAKYESFPHLAAAEGFLARSTANFCQRAFPHEPLLHRPQFFESKLILPPAMVTETFPAVEATAGLVNALTAVTESEDAMLSLALTLVAIPDELISSAAVALAAALSPDKIAAPLQAAATAKAFYMPQLRPAMMIARELLGKPSDWVKCLNEGQLALAVNLAAAEKKLGVLPLLWFSPEQIKEPQFREVLEPIAWSDAQGALDVIAKLETRGELAPELALERIFIWITLEKFESAEDQLQVVTKNLPVSGELRALVEELSGLLSLMLDEPAAALAHYERAHLGPFPDRHKRQTIAGTLAWCYMLNERYEDALRVLDQILVSEPHAVNAKINRAAALDALDRATEADEELDELRKYASFDRRVFISLMAQKG